MFIAGLTSVSFRKESIKTIVEKSKESGLSAVEWGGDIHVTNVNEAKTARENTLEKGLRVSSYGTYYSLGQNQKFDYLLKVASDLSAPIMRVWAGNKSPKDVSETEYIKMVEDARSICEKASKENIKVGLECHNNSITENRKSAMKFMNDVNHENLYFYWQPNQFLSMDENLASASDLCERTIVVHVFNWEGNNRYPLKDGIDKWKEYIKIFKGSKREIPLLLEFMHDDKLESLYETSQTLLEIIEKA